MRRIFLLLVVGMLLVSPLLVSAQLINPLIGPLVPCDGVASKDATGKERPECQVCHAVQLGQNIINFFVAIAAFIAIVIFAYAGFLMLTAAGDMTKISKAHTMFWNVLIGLVIVLAGWLIIDTVMKWTFQRKTDTDTERGSPLYEATKEKFGPWNEIRCAVLKPYSASTQPSPGGATPTPGPSGSREAGALCPSFNPNCSPAVIQAAGYTSAQANTMSCIAMTESSGFADGPNSSTGACGTFQITRGNWNNPSLHQGNCTIASSCNNAACNLQTAWLLSKRKLDNGKSPYSDWTCSGCNASAQACVNKYDPTQT